MIGNIGLSCALFKRNRIANYALHSA